MRYNPTKNKDLLNICTFSISAKPLHQLRVPKQSEDIKIPGVFLFHRKRVSHYGDPLCPPLSHLLTTFSRTTRRAAASTRCWWDKWEGGGASPQKYKIIWIFREATKSCGYILAQMLRILNSPRVGGCSVGRVGQ